MRTFLEHVVAVDEGNRLAKITKTLASGKPIGTVSPESGDMKGKAKDAAHDRIQGVLKHLSQRGYVSYTGPHAGRYKYAGDQEPSKEGSYVVSPRKASASRHFDKLMAGIGKRFNQQSVMRVKPSGEGDLLYTDKEHAGKSEHLGRIRYNKPLKTGSGDTKIGNSTFTVQE